MSSGDTFISIRDDVDDLMKHITIGAAVFQGTRILLLNGDPNRTVLHRHELNLAHGDERKQQVELRVFAKDDHTPAGSQRTQLSSFREIRALSNQLVEALQVIWSRPELTIALTMDYGTDYGRQIRGFFQEVNRVEQA